MGASVSDPDFSQKANFCGGCDRAYDGWLVYVVFSILIRLIGTNWINKILPPIVVGPMIAVIGLGLAGSACSNAGFVVPEGGTMNWQFVIVARLTILATALVAVYAKGFFTKSCRSCPVF